MTGWTMVASILLPGMAGALFFVWKRARTARTALEKFLHEDKERAARRRRVFEVLQGLGDAILQNQSDPNLHRLMTEGAARSVEAAGAVLYLLDEKRQVLVPRHSTRDCPPLIALPERIISQSQVNEGTLASFLRLHSIPAHEGVLGEVFTTQHAQKVDDLRLHPKFNGIVNPFQQHIAAVIAPLLHGSRSLGILAAATPEAPPFSQHALEMFASLAEQIGFALGNAQAHHEASAKDSIEAELRNASEIQRILLPQQSPDTPGLEIIGRNIPARLVSGDYYDFFPIGTAHVGIVIADVCGKGIAAALITAMCRSVLRSHARGLLSPASVLGAVNRNLFPDIREDMFITAAYLVAASDGSSLTLARAGHTTPLIWRQRTGKVEEVTSSGLAIGIDKGDVFERVTRDVTLSLESGDVLLLYTDGVNEASDQKELLFGEERINEILAQTAPQGAQAVIDTLCKAVNEFLAGEPQNDDITLVAIRRK
ncbi:MAG: SpoIIE family protein phosphatase [Verrucomicrobia bacterium]|nr:SpoIIE family protein phosphatase [Verrucomicrobiota bacterium]